MIVISSSYFISLYILVMKSTFSRIRFFMAFSGLFVLLCCGNKKTSETKLHFHIHHAYGFKAYLETIPFAGERSRIIDSTTVRNGDEIITFRITGNERPYKLKIRDSRVDILVINDS